MAFEQRLATPKMINEQIEQWMREVISSRDYERFRDLHIDMLDDALRSPENWIAGAYRCLEAALHIRNARELPFTVAIAISLRSSPLPRGVSFGSLAELRDELDQSPPSLYLVEGDTLPWTVVGVVVNLAKEFKLAGDVSTRACLHEWWNESDCEFRRTVWIAG